MTRDRGNSDRGMYVREIPVKMKYLVEFSK